MKTVKIDGVEYAPVQKISETVVLVRTDRAGVHVGGLVSHNGQSVTLSDARRLWRWRGANTLSEAVTKGIAHDWSRVSDPVSEVTLLDVIEILPVSVDAVESLTTSRWPK